MGGSVSSCRLENPALLCPWAGNISNSAALLEKFSPAQPWISDDGQSLNSSWFTTDQKVWNSTWFSQDQPFFIQGDGDISGQGIIVSLFLSSLLTAACSMALIILTWRERKKITHKSRTRLIQSLYAANLSLSDTQLITALAFSIAVYIKQCTLSVYHFQVSSWLQTVLLVTALASSSALIFASSWNDLSRKNWRINRRYLLGHIARIAVVCGIFATGSAYIGISSSTPAGLPDFPSPAMATNSICYYKDNTPKGAEIFAGSYWGSKGPMICLAVSFGTLLIFCVMSVWRNRKGIHRSKSSQLDRRLSMKFPTNSRSHRFFKFFFLSGFVLYILYVIPMAIAGVVVYNLHVKAARLMTVDQSEDRWTFGQIIPTIILVLPFLSFCETLLGIDVPEREPTDAEPSHAPIIDEQFKSRGFGQRVPYERVNSDYSHTPLNRLDSDNLQRMPIYRNDSGFSGRTR